MNKRDRKKLISSFGKAENRLLLLDYDGTLVEIQSEPEKAILPAETYNTLKKIAENPHNKVVIISGRREENISSLLDDLPVDIFAEHGSMVREKGIWKVLYSGEISWKTHIISQMKHFISECQGSVIEEKKFSVAWHYRNADMVSGFQCSRKLIGMLNESLSDHNLKILDGNKVVEVIGKNNGKGSAVAKLTKNNTYDFILAAGDDATDEQMFEYLADNKNVYTVKVGKGDTYAGFKVKNITEIVSLLKQLSL